MVINKNILFRYESKIDEGKLFIFDIENYKVYKGSYAEYLILSAIRKGKDTESIKMTLRDVYRKSEISSEQIEKFISKLVAKGIVDNG